MTSAAEVGEFVFEVRRDGDPIGKHYVKIVREDDRVVVDVEVDLEVKIIEFPVFSYDHQRQEIWENGKLVRLAAFTDDDGDVFDIEMESNGDGLIRRVNDEEEHLDPDVFVLTLWNPDVLNHEKFASAFDADLHNFKIDYMGRESVPLMDRSVEADHYVLKDRWNDRQVREIWYGPEGFVVMANLRKHDSLIEFVLDKGDVCLILSC